MEMLLDGRSRKSIITSLRRMGAKPADILYLARDSDVKDAADCAWSLQVLLLAPRALREVADIMDAPGGDDPKDRELALKAAKEILAHARQVSKQEIDRMKLSGTKRDERPPLQVPPGGGLKELVSKAHEIAQKGTSSGSNEVGGGASSGSGGASSGAGGEGGDAGGA